MIRTCLQSLENSGMRSAHTPQLTVHAITPDELRRADGDAFAAFSTKYVMPPERVLAEEPCPHCQSAWMVEERMAPEDVVRWAASDRAPLFALDVLTSHAARWSRRRRAFAAASMQPAATPAHCGRPTATCNTGSLPSSTTTVRTTSQLAARVQRPCWRRAGGSAGMESITRGSASRAHRRPASAGATRSSPPCWYTVDVCNTRWTTRARMTMTRMPRMTS